MTTRKLASTLGVAAAGLAAALLIFPAVGQSAWNWQSLPTGYVSSSFQTTCHTATDPCVNGEGSTCNHVTISGAGVRQFAETDCVNPTFAADVDAYVDSTICTVNAAAGGQACAPTTTATPAPTTTVAATTTTPAVTTTPAPVATTTAAAAAPAPVTVPAQTVTVATPTSTETVTVPAVTTPAVPSTVADAISLLQQQIMVLQGRVQAIEQHLGLIVGEEKNETPFTEPT